MVFVPLFKPPMMKTIIIFSSTGDYRNCVCERRQTGESGRRWRKVTGKKGEREEWERKEATEEEEETIK